jgi:hypothetical protein
MGVRNQYFWFGSLFLDPRKKLLASSAIVERGGFAAIAQSARSSAAARSRPWASRIEILARATGRYLVFLLPRGERVAAKRI